MQMIDSIQHTPESPSATIDRLSNNVQTLSHQLRDIANILGVDVDEIPSAILRERKESESRESLTVSAAVMATELLRELLADSIVMSWIKAHDKHKGTMYEQRMRSLVDGSPKAEANGGGAEG